jgi:hypothetical protein
MFNGCMQPDALSTMTQLEPLSFWFNDQDRPPGSIRQLLSAVSGLQQLAELQAVFFFSCEGGEQHDPAAFTELASSTDLQSLQLGLCPALPKWGPPFVTIFRPGSVYPHLRRIDLQFQCSKQLFGVYINEQQLEQLCSSCPSLVTTRWL